MISHHKIVQEFETVPLPGIHQNGIVRNFVARKKKYLFFKRLFDILVSGLVLIAIISWLFPLIALLITLDSRGPVLFRQRRIGLNGRTFLCLKFRTMIINEEANELPATENDPRITRPGKFLRRWNLDELPQFFNVLIGQMSIVGPRPHMVSDCTRFSFVVPSYRFRQLMKPGITGWAQVKGFHGPAINYEGIITRYYWDAAYIRQASFGLDMRIVLQTILRENGKVKVEK